MLFLNFPLYFYNQEKGLVWDFHQLPIHLQNEWNRLDHLELVGSRLTTFIHAFLSCLHLMRPGQVCK